MAERATLNPTRARALYEEGYGCNAIARELGVDPATVSRWAKREGLSFAREQQAVANIARSVDAKTRRLDMLDRLYARALKNLDRLDAAQFQTLVREFGGGEAEKTLDFVPTQNERDLTQAISTALMAATRLEAVDANSAALPAAHSLLDSLAAGFTAAAASYEATDVAE